MIEIRFHGRGGQGAVTSAEMLALAAIGEGKYAQAFPSFGPERRGAPVVAFCRIDDKPIRIRANIYEPDIGGCAGCFPAENRQCCRRIETQWDFGHQYQRGSQRR